MIQTTKKTTSNSLAASIGSKIIINSMPPEHTCVFVLLSHLLDVFWGSGSEGDRVRDDDLMHSAEAVSQSLGGKCFSILLLSFQKGHIRLNYSFIFDNLFFYILYIITSI